MKLLQYWEGIVTLLGIGGGYIIGRKSRNIQNKRDDAIAEQEQVKIKKEDVSLSQMIQETYQRLNRDVLLRLEELEKNYNDILLRNAVLEERAETYESKYRDLEKLHIKLKADHDKLHKENKEIRKELDELKGDKK